MRSLLDRRRRRLAAAVAVWTCAGLGRARAITIRDDVDPSLYVALGAQSQYAAEGFLEVNTGSSGNVTNYNFQTATLIAPDWILTAAHGLVNGTSAYSPSLMTFGQGATAGFPAPISVSQVIIESGFNGNLTVGNDLALVQLSTPVTSVAPATIYSSSLGTLVGQTATVVGYGYTGTGSQGYNTSVIGTRRAMQNVIDTFGQNIVFGGADGDQEYNLSNFSRNIMFTDFDSPNSADWETTNIMGDPTPLPLEGATAPGDSGGGVFVCVNGQTYLAGVTSFGDNMTVSPPLSEYGDFDGYTALTASSSLNLINSTLVTTSSWNQSGGGTWAGLADWSNSNIPEFARATANFGGAITTASTVTLDAAWTVGTINFNNTNSYTLAAGNGGSLTLDSGRSNASAALTDNGGTHFITAPLALNSNLLVTIVNPGDSLLLSGLITGGTNLTIAGSGTLRFGPGVSTPTFGAVTVNSGATLDISTNAVAINYGSPGDSPIAQIAAALGTGYNSGTWTGTGITSSAAAVPGAVKLSVGYADGNTDTGTTAQPNQVLIKYTLAGDANLDGVVNFADFAIVLKYFDQGGTDWSQGNFEYATTGATTNFNDFADVLRNFLQPIPGAGSSEALGNNVLPLGEAALVSVDLTGVQLPEPGAAVLGAVGALGLLSRRRQSENGRGQ